MRLATLVLASSLIAIPAIAQDADRTVADGGIKVDGWHGRIDRRPMSQGLTINDSKFAAAPDGFRVSVGPAGIFWNDAHTASGNYEVKATFKEHQMSSSHPHPYGVFIGGANLESDGETLLYCIVYGTGVYSIKTFHGANVSTLVDREAHAALKQADASGEVTNEIGWRVAGDQVSCVVNGTVVKTLNRADVVGADKLVSTDGIYGFRASHNLELTVTGLSMTDR